MYSRSYANTREWLDFRLQHKCYHIIDISSTSLEVKVAMDNLSSVLRCTTMHLDFDHCILKLYNFHIGDDDEDAIIPCNLHASVDPNPNWWQDVDFRTSFQIDEM